MSTLTGFLFGLPSHYPILSPCFLWACSHATLLASSPSWISFTLSERDFSPAGWELAGWVKGSAAAAAEADVCGVGLLAPKLTLPRSNSEPVALLDCGGGVCWLGAAADMFEPPSKSVNQLLFWNPGVPCGVENTPPRGSSDGPPGVNPEYYPQEGPPGVDDGPLKDGPPGVEDDPLKEGPPGVDDGPLKDGPPGVDEGALKEGPPGVEEDPLNDGPPGVDDGALNDGPPGVADGAPNISSRSFAEPPGYCYQKAFGA